METLNVRHAPLNSPAFRFLDKKKHSIPREVKYLIAILENAGFQAYLVGGAVRDLIRGYNPKDWDVATNASAESVQEIVEAQVGIGVCTCKLVGAAFQVSLVTIGDLQVEVARFREEHGTVDNRHPEHVEFVSTIEKDLLRRDFTVNAIAINSKEVVYVEGAIEDCQNKVLRTVGIPTERFEEDALRILRAFRFMSEKGLNISPVTLWGCNECRRLLGNISYERIRDEFFKILNGHHVTKTLMKMAEYDVLQSILTDIIPCVHMGQYPKYHKYTVLEHMARTVQHLPQGHLRIAGFFHDIGKPPAMFFDPDGTPHFYGGKLIDGIENRTLRHEEYSHLLVHGILSRWNCSLDLIAKVDTLVLHHDHPFLNRPTAKGARKLVNLVGIETAFELVELRNADRIGNGIIRDDIKGLVRVANKFLQEVEDNENATKITDLAVNGHDVMKTLGVSGPAVGRVLTHLLNVVLDNPTHNTLDYLMKEMKTITEPEEMRL